MAKEALADLRAGVEIYLTAWHAWRAADRATDVARRALFAAQQALTPKEREDARRTLEALVRTPPET